MSKNQRSRKNNCQNIWRIARIVVPLHSQKRNEEHQSSQKHRGVEQLVARQAHNLEVACSSPASATNIGVTS